MSGYGHKYEDPTFLLRLYAGTTDIHLFGQARHLLPTIQLVLDHLKQNESRLLTAGNKQRALLNPMVGVV